MRMNQSKLIIGVYIIFNNISSWRLILLVEETRKHGETTKVPQVTDNLYQI